MRAVKVIFSRCALLAAAWLVAGATGCEAAQDSFADVAAPEKSETEQLSTDEVKKIIAQAANEASAINKPATIVVTDRVGNVLAAYRMNGAPLVKILLEDLEKDAKKGPVVAAKE